MNERDLRMMRIGGREPTMRDRWLAFHRLFRMAQKLDAANVGGRADDCFHTLWDGPPETGWYLMLKGTDRLEINHVMPVEIRWSKVRRARAKRRFTERRKAEKLLAAIFRPVPEGNE